MPIPRYMEASSPGPKGRAAPRKYASDCWTQKSTIPSKTARLFSKWL